MFPNTGISNLMLADTIKKTMSNNKADTTSWNSAQTKNLILVTAPFIFITTDIQGKIRNVNPAIRKIFGYYEGDVEGKPLSMLVPELESMEYAYFTQVSMRGELEMFTADWDQGEDTLAGDAITIADYNYLERFIYGHAHLTSKSEIETRKSDGTPIWIDLTVNKVIIDDQSLYTIVITEITSRKEKEVEIVRLNEDLEGKVADRTQQLEQSNEELKQALKDLKAAQENLIETEKMAALGDLVAGVAHEINTPIGVGVTAASHLHDETEGISLLYSEKSMRKTDFERYLKLCRQSSDIILTNLLRAAEQVKSFKMIAVDQTTEQKRCFPLRKYLEDVITSLRPRLKKTKLEVKIECDLALTLETYPGSISQIITNLILNSILHAYKPQESGQILLQAFQDSSKCHIIYSDNGRGMTHEENRRVFEPFFTTKRSEGGTGLGMHIIFNLVEHQLKGKITCSSKLGQGARFHIALPR